MEIHFSCSNSSIPLAGTEGDLLVLCVLSSPPPSQGKIHGREGALHTENTPGWVGKRKIGWENRPLFIFMDKKRKTARTHVGKLTTVRLDEKCCEWKPFNFPCVASQLCVRLLLSQTNQYGVSLIERAITALRKTEKVFHKQSVLRTNLERIFSWAMLSNVSSIYPVPEQCSGCLLKVWVLIGAAAVCWKLYQFNTSSCLSITDNNIVLLETEKQQKSICTECWSWSDSLIHLTADK